MKKLKSLLLLIAVAAAGASASAKAGIEAGYMSMRYGISGGNTALQGTSMNGFYVGVSDDVRIVAGLGIRIGLNYSYTTDKSARSIFNDFNINMKGGSEKDHYLNVPLRVRYTFNIIPKVLKIQAYAGPVFSVGLSHTYSYDMTVSIQGQRIEGSLKYNFYKGKFKSDALDDVDLQVLDLPAYKRFDMALGGGVGIELFNFLELKAGYDWGLTDKVKGDLAGSVSCRRDMFYAAVGFRF